MLTSVFAKSIRDQRRGLIGWGIGTVATIVVMGAIWPSFSDTNIDALLENYPSELAEVFNVAAMNTGVGYLNSELFSIVLPVMFIIYGVGRGARLLAGEEEAGTLAIVLTMPIPRMKVLFEKAAGLIVGLGLLAGVLGVAVWVVSLVFDMGVSPRAAAFGALSQWSIGVEFALLALAVAAATGRRAWSIGIPAGGRSWVLCGVPRLPARGVTRLAPVAEPLPRRHHGRTTRPYPASVGVDDATRRDPRGGTHRRRVQRPRHPGLIHLPHPHPRHLHHTPRQLNGVSHEIRA
ncbi:MAG: ABC transporter permease [Microthrixaceae bacterium]|nr:ABC transporter permease [Microthrixaceae bacterium]